MARVRRNTWVAIATCGLLCAMAAVGCEGKKTKSMPADKGKGLPEGQTHESETEKEVMLTGEPEGIPWKGGLVLSREPRLGEVVTATLSITPEEDVCDVRVGLKPLKGVEVVTGDTIAYAKFIPKGTTREFSIGVRFVSSPARITYGFDGVNAPVMTTIGGRCGLTRFIIDDTNQFVPIEELSRRGVELKTDPFAGGTIEIMNPVVDGPWAWNGGVALSREPALGETVDVTFTVTAFDDLHNVRVIFGELRGVEIVDGDSIFHLNMIRKGETRKFRVKARFFSAPATIAVSMPSDVFMSVEPFRGGAVLTRVIVDEETGQFGTEGEYRNSRLEFRYSPADGMWLEVGEPGYADWNRRIIATAKKLEPALSDSEALCLHADIYNQDTPYKYLGPVLPEKESLSDEEMIKYLLGQGWLEKHREGDEVKRSWLKALSEKHKKQVEDLKRKGIWKNSGQYLRRFIGGWRFKDHHYDKDQGLLADFDVKPVKSVKARIFTYYVYQSNFYRDYSDWAATNDDGSFSIVTDWPYNVDTSSSFVVPVVFPCGPDPGNPAISVTDPNITIPSYWKDPDDPTLYPMREMGFGEPHYLHEQWYDTLIDLDQVWTDTFPRTAQPQSGCVNIYETLLQGYDYLVPTYTSPSEIGRVRAMWEPGYVRKTGYKQDTIFVRGGVYSIDTDEWDDDVLMHEYGHHSMDHLAERPPGAGGDHWWWHSYNLGLAYSEGWADLFSSVVRNDTMFVNTKKGIGGDSTLWHNIENPWSFSDSVRFSHWLTWPSRRGSECEATVAGALWDIYDEIEESHDTLCMGFDEVWTVVTSDTLGSYCHSIHEFQAAWRTYGYGHYDALRSIYHKHRIIDTQGILMRVIDVTGESKADRTDWATSSPPGGDSKTLVYFRLYRSDTDIGPYGKIDSVDYLPPETLYTYRDSTVQYAMPYWYRVGAVDEAGFEYLSDADSATPYDLPSPPAPPGPVTNLTGTDTPFDEGGSTTLTWLKSPDDSIIVNYYIFRTLTSGSGYACIDSVGAGVETYEDTLAVDGDTLYYMVRAHNGTNGSNSEEAWAVSKPNSVGTSDTVLATAFNNARKIAADSANVHVVFQSEGQIWYSACDAQGGDWSTPLSLGDGKTPSLDLDMQGDPHVVWVGPEEPQGTWLYYARYDGGWNVDSLLFVTSNTRPYLPSFQVDDSAYGHIVWEEHAWMAETPVLVNYAVFNTQNPASISVENIDAMFGNGWFCSASVTLDSADVPHVVWRKEDQGRIYYSFRDTGTHTWTPPELISQGVAMRAEWPCLDFCGNSVSAVWMASTGLVPPDIFYRSRALDSLWAPIEPVHLSMDSSGYPVIVAGCYVFWAQRAVLGPNNYDWEICGRRRAPDGAWDALTSVSNSPDVDSRFPQAAFWQDADTGYLYVAWAEGDSAQFGVMVKRLEVPRVPGWTETMRAAVEEGLSLTPRVFALAQNYPNPCRELTIIKYQLPKPVRTTLKVYDVSGRLVRALVDEEKKPGYYTATWNGKDSSGRKVASGVYFYRLFVRLLTSGNRTSGQTGDFTATKKMILMR